MHLVDHIFILLLFVVMPIYGAWSYKGYLERIAAGFPPNRVRLYQQTMVQQWAAFAVVAGVWTMLGRPASELGFVASSTIQLWGGASALALVTAYLLYAWSAAGKMNSEDRSTAVAGLGTLVHFLPGTIVITGNSSGFPLPQGSSRNFYIVGLRFGTWLTSCRYGLLCWCRRLPLGSGIPTRVPVALPGSPWWALLSAFSMF